MLHSALMNVMVKAARRAGRSLKRDLGEVEHLQVSLKGPANFVTMADRRAEEMLYSDLSKARPGYGFIGEEGGNREGADKSHTWIVDPLDGTTNFLHGIPQFAISIGLQREGTMIAGVIYNPANDELYTAERGKGAFLNDQRLRVAGRRQLGDCVIACGLPHIGRGDHALSRLEMTEIQNRVAGSARPRSIWPSSRPAGWTVIGNAICSHGTWRPGRSWCAKPAAPSAASPATKTLSRTAMGPPAINTSTPVWTS